MSARGQIAIVGIGCRLPGGVSSPAQLARFLRACGDGVVDVPADRWNVDLHYHADPAAPGKSYVRRGGFLRQDVFSFDPTPFGISPREADHLDPQQRLLLEVSFEALEDGGIPAEKLKGSATSVFVGGFTLDHQTLAYASQNRALVSSHTSVGSSMTLLSNRLSYTFDLRGPSMTVDTACSSSLVAVHLGCESILRGEAELSLVGGVTVMLSPATMVAMSKGQFLSKDGRSKTFDAQADGYGRGEGAAVLVLKRLDRALSDRDRIYAVISATGVNQDGRTDGIALPNGEAQRELCARVLRASGLAPWQVGYVEAHGTGTRAGDPIEVRALGAVYGTHRTSPLLIGSIKTNIGHLEAAAGVVGLLKAALTIHYRELFPIRALGTPNPDIDFEGLHIQIARETRALASDGSIHVAVNSFGYGGTNAHAIVSSAPESAPPSHQSERVPSAAASRALAAPRDESRLSVVPLSAASPGALRARAEQLAEVAGGSELADLGYTLARRRAQLTERAALVVRSARELQDVLARVARGEQSDACVIGRAAEAPRLLWVFTGMGPQWWGMGAQLYAAEPAYRRAAEEADEAFAAAAGWSVLAEMLRSEPDSHMASNAIAQPANFVLQVGLVGLLRSLGVPAHGILGHSVGELVAAWSAGCLNLTQAGYLAFHRSRLQQKVAGRGGMLAVALSAGEAEPLLRDFPGAEIAAYNAPKSLAIAADVATLGRISAELDRREIFNRRMAGEVAYHSAHMDELAWGFASALKDVGGKAPSLPLYSTAYGARVEQPVHDAQYWWANARRPVLLQKALELALADGFTAFLELGPHPVLSSAIKETATASGRSAQVFHCLKRKEPEQLRVHRTVGELYCAGIELDWKQHYAEGHLCELPTYPFQREHFWTESQTSREARLGRSTGSGLFSHSEAGLTLRCGVDLSRPALDFLFDHQIQGEVVFAGAGYVDAVLSACEELDPEAPEWVLEQVSFERALLLRRTGAPALLVDLEHRRGAFGVFARHGDEAWQLHARGRLVRGARFASTANDLERLSREHDEALDIPATYRRLHQLGLQYDPQFQRLGEVHVRRAPDGLASVLARLLDAPAAPGVLHPALLDAAFQALLAALDGVSSAMVPIVIEQIRWSKQQGLPCWAFGKVTHQDRTSVVADIELLGAHGQRLLELRGVTCRALDQRTRDTGDALSEISYVDTWQAKHFSALSAVGQRWAFVGSDEGVFQLLEGESARVGVRVERADESQFGALAGASHVVFAVTSRGDDPVALEALDLLRRLVPATSAAGARLRVVTRGAEAQAAADGADPAQSALWGFARVIMTEHPELDTRLIDLPLRAEASASQLLGLIGSQVGEEETLLRGDSVYARRLRRLVLDEGASAIQEVSAATHVGAYALALPRDADADQACYAAQPRSEPGPGEVELEVCASLLERGDERALVEVGPEGAARSRLRAFVGRVIRCGAGTSRLANGDLSFALASERPSSHALVPEAQTLRLARGHEPASALTYGEHILAWHALMHVAHLQAGEIALILDAASALGAAAARVARALGARVFAVARGVPDARLLKDLGAERGYSSETLDFVDAIARDLAVDELALLVSPSSGPAQEKALTLLPSGGRFVALRLAPERESGRLELSGAGNLSAAFVDLESLAMLERERFVRAARAVAAAFEEGSLALPSERVFPSSQAAEALRALQSAERVALDFSARDARVSVRPEPQPLFAADRSYLITGGLSGFGLATAEWLAAQGAGHIVLGSRRGKADASARAALGRIQRAGASVECIALDVSDPSSLRSALEHIDRHLPKLAGIFHSAMELDDRPIGELDRAALRKVLAPKALGAHHLYELTRARNLDHLVFYSSISASVGNPAQASYAAANAFLEGLAARARAEGVPATAVSWGALGDVGVVARNQGTAAHLESLGIKPVPAKLALAGLERVLRGRERCVSLVDMQWNRWVESFPSTPWHRLEDVIVAEDAGASRGGLAALRAEVGALAPAEQLTVVRDRVRAATCRVLRLDTERVDDASTLRNYGLDSLMALELQTELLQLTGVTFPTIQILAGISIVELSARVLARLGDASPEAPNPATLGAVVPSESRALRDYLLGRICVQPPYFALRELTQVGDAIEATVDPLAPSADEADIVSCAEAARHLAIAGSCAVSLRCPLPGKVYYPVLRAEYPLAERDASKSLLALEAGVLTTARVRARCLGFDLERGRASAATELLDQAGNVVTRLQVDYHVIPQAEFARLFAAHARASDEGSGHDPYRSWDTSAIVSRTGGEGRPASLDNVRAFSMNLGPIQPRACLGHFVGYPALPVSIMTRHAVRLIAEAVRSETGWDDAQVRVVCGVAETRSFVFSPASALLVARRLRQDAIETWRCEVRSEGKVAASFELGVEVRRPRKSSVESRRGQRPRSGVA